LNIPDLHEDIHRDQKFAWFNWANELKEGTSFFASAQVAANWSSIIHPSLGNNSQPIARVRSNKLNLVALANSQSNGRLNCASKQAQKITGSSEKPLPLTGFQSLGLFVRNLHIVPQANPYVAYNQFSTSFIDKLPKQQDERIAQSIRLQSSKESRTWKWKIEKPWLKYGGGNSQGSVPSQVIGAQAQLHPANSPSEDKIERSLQFIQYQPGEGSEGEEDLSRKPSQDRSKQDTEMLDAHSDALARSSIPSGDVSQYQLQESIGIQDTRLHNPIDSNSNSEPRKLSIDEAIKRGSYQQTVNDYTQVLASRMSQSQWISMANEYGETFRDKLCQRIPMPRNKLNSTEVYVWKNLSILISWINSSGKTYNFLLRPPSSCQQADTNDRRYIFLYVLRLMDLGSNTNRDSSTKDGIDIRREDNTSCLVQSRALSSINLVTFPLVHLNTSQRSAELGNMLIQLWEAETCLNWAKLVHQPKIQSSELAQLSDDDAIPLPRSFFTGLGRELVRANWKEDRLALYKVPPQPSDEMWLISQFLNTQWPDGGTIFIGVPENWPERQCDNIWTLLRS
jgi:hypothetical protein